jgi:hypothetical protein
MWPNGRKFERLDRSRGLRPKLHGIPTAIDRKTIGRTFV